MATKPNVRAAKPVSKATQDLLAAMNEDANQPVSEDKLERVRDEIKKLRELEFENAGMSERIKQNSEKIQTLKNKTLVDLFDNVGITNLGIAPDGNLPQYDIVLDDYFHANIPAENQERAYKWMKDTGNEDLIKTSFTIEFGLGEDKDAVKFEKLLDKNSIAYSKKQGVPWNTLTAFVKEQFKVKKKPLTAKVLGMLGATVGRVAKVVKEKKQKGK